MSQLGMQMPGSTGPTRASLNVYTGLTFLAVLCLAVAVGLMWRASTTLAPPDGGAMAPLTLQDEANIRLAP